MFNIVCQRVVIEEKFFNLGKGITGVLDFFSDVLNRPGPVIMPADGLRPKAISASRFTAAARVNGHIGVQHVPVVIVFGIQKLLINGRHPRQGIHVMDDGSGASEPDLISIAIIEPYHIS